MTAKHDGARNVQCSSSTKIFADSDDSEIDEILFDDDDVEHLLLAHLADNLRKDAREEARLDGRASLHSPELSSWQFIFDE